MPISRAQRRATEKYEKENYDKIVVRFPIGTKEKIQRTGAKSYNEFIKKCVMEKLTDVLDEESKPKKATSLAEMRKLLDERKAAEQKRKEAIEQAKEAEKESKRIESLTRDPERKTEE